MMKKILLLPFLLISCYWTEDFDSIRYLPETETTSWQYDTTYFEYYIDTVPYIDARLKVEANEINCNKPICLNINGEVLITSLDDSTTIKDCKIFSDKDFSIMQIERSRHSEKFWCGANVEIDGLYIKMIKVKQIKKNN